MFLELVTFQYFVVHLSLLEWLLPPKEQEGGAQLSRRGKQLQIGKLLKIEPDIDSRSWGTAERGKWMFQVQLLLDNYNNWRGSGNIIREKSGEFRFK